MDYRWSVAILLALGLIGCGKKADTVSAPHHGRYVGVGTYSAGELWSRIVFVDAAKDRAAATTADDEHVIVLLDSDTGQLRECGDYSGHCIILNPWARSVTPQQGAPVALTEHAAQLERENGRALSATITTAKH